MQTYQGFKSEWTRPGHNKVDYDHVFAYQCVDLILQFLYECAGVGSGVSGNAIDYATKPSPAFVNATVKVTDGSKVAGDILVFKGADPDGHIALRDTNLDQMLEQNAADGNGSGVGRDAIGVYRNIPYDRLVAVYRIKQFVNIPAAAPAPAGVSAPAGKKLFLPSAAGTWRVYNVAGPFSVGHEVGKLAPGNFPPGLTYDVLGQIAPNIVRIHTESFGEVAIYIGADTIAQFVDPAPAAPATPPPAPAPAAPAAPQLPPKPANVAYTKLATPLSVVVNKNPTHVWKLDFVNDSHATSVADLNQGTPFVAFGKAQRTDGDKPAYFMTEADFGSADVTGVPASNVGVNTVDVSPAAPAEPKAPAASVPAETPAAPSESEAVPVKVTVKSWQDSFKENAGTFKATIDATIHDLAGKLPDTKLGHDQTVHVAGFVTKEGEQYAITLKSHAAGNWYGVPKSILVASSGSKVVDALSHPAATAKAAADDIEQIAEELNHDPEFAKFKSTLTPRGKLVADIAEAEDKVAGVASKLNFFKRKYK